jgi:hypothetical protein
LKGDGTFIVTGKVFLGGKELPKLHDVYRKVGE